MTVAFVLFALAGCGPQLGQVYGKINFEGKPVPAGSVLFVPQAPADEIEAGKPASGAPGPSGEFQLSTFSRHDGARIGTHVVTYSAPTRPLPQDKEGYDERLELYNKYGNLRLPQKLVVEVKPGRNDLVIELVSVQKADQDRERVD